MKGNMVHYLRLLFWTVLSPVCLSSVDFSLFLAEKVMFSVGKRQMGKENDKTRTVFFPY